ncbi:MAG: hypothetical protein KC619_14635 [Myxococcales bacterium]|nr:hypothetical protein [Myxococcales bacterium]
MRCFSILLALALIQGCTDTRGRRDAGSSGGFDAGAPPPIVDGCVPDCSGRLCGLDPVCGQLCGTCDMGTCEDGRCVGGSTGGGPRILSLETNVTTLRSDQTLIVTAVVTDPDGVDDLIGGSLVDPASGASYGAFATSASEGSYELRLDWGALDTVTPIDAPVTGVERRFRARFFDVAGNAAESDFAVTLRCATDGESACDGACVDLMSDRDHCGACDAAVPSSAICRDGVPGCLDTADSLCGTSCLDTTYDPAHCGSCDHACPSWSGRTVTCESGGTCRMQDTFYSRAACGTTCADHGYTCVSALAYYYTSGGGYDSMYVSCSETPPAAMPTDPGSTWESVSCRCVHTSGGSTCATGPENTTAACTDGCDNDGDPYVDCDDFDCCSVVTCPMGTACYGRI